MRVFLVAWLPVFFVVGCGDKLECGEGTHEADSICVPDEESDADGSADSDDTGETDGDADGSADSDDTGETDGDADGSADDTGTDPVDSDEDGFTADEDCDDTDGTVFPGAEEVPYDGIDQDCSGTDLTDVDGDGYDASVGHGTDCDDTDAEIHPDASETCNGIDDNCDGSIDEGVTTAVFRDLDGDGYGTEAESIDVCTMPIGYVATDTDCDDSDAGVHPGAIEVCNGIDNDCDGDVDDSAIDADEFYADSDGDGYGDVDEVVSACELPEGHARDHWDCDDSDSGVHPEAEEFCDLVDNDCDGAIDEASAFDAGIWYDDGDGDGYGDGTPVYGCDAPTGAVAMGGDCDDSDSAVHPGADEVCDLVDNNCDGDTDEAGALDALTWYRDADGDGYGDPSSTTLSCTLPAGYLETAGDCNDESAADHPDAVERCDGLDNDCDPTTTDDDSEEAEVWYVDSDGDGYGSADGSLTACDMPSGYSGTADDCNDGAMMAYPGGTEVCDGLDNDCNGEVDGPDSEDIGTWYIDSDGDGFGDAADSELACDVPSGFVADSTDCDDGSAEALPGGTEVCDGLDNDCDGVTDDLPDCGCDLVSVDSPNHYVTSGGTHGAWMQDPLETLGENLVWEFGGYSDDHAIKQFPDLTSMAERTGESSFSVSPHWDGTGHVIYDGHLYYNQSHGNTIQKVDLGSLASVGTLYLPEAGYRNTYAYQWGGYSDIDLAVDEDGLWAIYATASNGGRLVLSKIDIDTFTITETWNTTSTNKNSIGNAFMICGKLYATSSYSDSTATINYKFDPVTGVSTNPGISIENPGGYNSSIDYNPAERKLYSWDSARRQTYDLVIE